MPLPIPQMFGNESYLFQGRLPLKVGSDVFGKLLYDGHIIDGRSGGLVLGRSHNEGHIYIIGIEGDGFIINSCLEGGEYVMNQNAKAEYEKEIVQINSDTTGSETPISSLEITPFLRVFSCGSVPFDRLLWLEKGQYIINRGATKRHLKRLIELDLCPNDRVNFNLSSALLMAQATDSEDE